MKRILISTGDFSADLHGASLVRELKNIEPDLRVAALGGIKLKEVSDEFLIDMVDLDVSGFSQPVKQFFNLKRILQHKVFPRLTPEKTDAVVLIDYYGFNIHVARKAKERGIPVYYFVSPQVWASRKHRIGALKEVVTRMLVIFPFEEKLYKEHGVPVQFVGHPLMDAVAQAKRTERDGKLSIGLMPGSRIRELVRHVPIMLQAFSLLRGKFPQLDGTLFAADNISDETYLQLIRKVRGISQKPEDLPKIVRDRRYEKRLQMDLCLTASGTATLENALLGLPMVVIYQTSFLTYWIAKKIIQVPFISMANILSGRLVVPELIQDRANSADVAREAERFLSDPALLERTRGELIKLKHQLGEPGAYRRAALSILERKPVQS